MGYYDSDSMVVCEDTGEIVKRRDYLTTTHWKNMRRETWEYAGHECARCHDPLSLDQMVAHHRTYKRLGKEQKGDLVCLCPRCHKIIHKKRIDARDWNARIIDAIKPLTDRQKEKALKMIELIAEGTL